MTDMVGFHLTEDHLGFALYAYQKSMVFALDRLAQGIPDDDSPHMTHWKKLSLDGVTCNVSVSWFLEAKQARAGRHLVLGTCRWMVDNVEKDTEYPPLDVEFEWMEAESHPVKLIKNSWLHLGAVLREFPEFAAPSEARALGSATPFPKKRPLKAAARRI
jgi:hypothetical protein